MARRQLPAGKAHHLRRRGGTPRFREENLPKHPHSLRKKILKSSTKLNAPNSTALEPCVTLKDLQSIINFELVIGISNNKLK